MPPNKRRPLPNCDVSQQVNKELPINKSQKQEVT